MRASARPPRERRHPPRPALQPLGRLHDPGPGRPDRRRRAIRARPGAVAHHPIRAGMGQARTAGADAAGPSRMARSAGKQRSPAARPGQLRAGELGRRADARHRRDTPGLGGFRERVDLRRLLWLDELRAVSSRLHPAEAHAQPLRRLHRPCRHLFDRGRPGDPAPHARRRYRLRWPGQHAGHDRREYRDAGRVRRAVPPHRAERGRWHRNARAGGKSQEDRRAGHQGDPGVAAARRCAGLAHVRMVADPTQHRRRADAGAGGRDRQSGSARYGLFAALHERRGPSARLSRRHRRWPSARMQDGQPGSPGWAPSRSHRSPGSWSTHGPC